MNADFDQSEPKHDEVDRIVLAWQQQRPDLDVRPLSVLSRITRLARYLDRARAEAFAAHDLEVWEFDVLSALRRAGHPYELTPGSLLAQTLVTSGTMTNRVQRLEHRGLVLRRPDPDDGRGVLVRLTEQGLAMVDVALVALLEYERELLAGLNENEQAQMAGLLRQMVSGFEDRTLNSDAS